MVIRNIAEHHSGGFNDDNFASTAHLSIVDINAAHRERWNFKSTLGYFGGYNFIIDREGRLLQYRAIGEETMAQKGHNFDTISICRIGNFNRNPKTGKQIDIPTTSQQQTRRALLVSLFEYPQSFAVAPETKFDLSIARIQPHRFYWPTDCYGTSLLNSEGGDIMLEYYYGKLEILKRIVSLRLKVQNYLSPPRLGVVEPHEAECEGMIKLKNHES